MKKALSIAGSDSSAGAGIQADIKTFSALGLYGTTVITVLTAQNTKIVSDILVVPSKFFRNQLVDTINDIQPNVAKLGVLYDNSIIDIVYETLSSNNFPIVVDPVLVSGTGIKLLRDESFDNYVKKIIPLSHVITPNLKEAEIISGLKIQSQKEAIKAAERIMEFGAQNVIIKGIGLGDDEIIDILLEKHNNQITRASNKRLGINDTHGTGCNFSSSLSSFIAKGYSIKRSFQLANSFVAEALANSTKLGSGINITNPLQNMYINSCRYRILSLLQKTVRKLEKLKHLYLLIPETKTNFVFCIENPANSMDVAGVLGRISNVGKAIRTPNVVEFGSSHHLSNAIIEANRFNVSLRSVINIKNNKRILDICKRNFSCSYYNRKDEPLGDRLKEGSTIKWGISSAFRKAPEAEVVFHDGDYGKEPMILIYGNDPQDVYNKVKLVLSNLQRT
ncbi:MAG: bifunctional hydroxymethylpyrimidine kinase/phosphomethylpyrimidine kinase [Thermoproteota archaeon]|nr:bifunctional hydroxymethylpyrimidine kinase/phosphomethylpyrimidine kinase [Thermoproteota archaeon]